MASNNKTLIKFVVDGIPPALREMPQIEVVFKIDANGILNITSKDKISTQELKIIPVTKSPGLSRNEVKKILKEIEEYKKKVVKSSLNLTKDKQ